MKYSSNIKQLRESLHLTLEQLATKSGLSLNQLTALEDGTAQTINSTALLGLARALGTDVGQLFFSVCDDSKPSPAVNSKAEAAWELADDICIVLRDAELANHIMGLLFDQFFNDALDHTPRGLEKLAVGFTYAQPLANILLDYIHRLTVSLRSLDALAIRPDRERSSSRRDDISTAVEQ